MGTPTQKPKSVMDWANEIAAVTDGILDLAGQGKAEAAVGLIAQLAGVAIAAWHDASGTPITPESVQALVADRTPLVLPKS